MKTASRNVDNRGTEPNRTEDCRQDSRHVRKPAYRMPLICGNLNELPISVTKAVKEVLLYWFVNFLEGFA